MIPARGGSKGIPRKNIATLGEKPLLDYTIEAASRALSHITRLVVSTDDEEIAGLARRAGAEVPFVRPANLATDRARTVDVVVHALETLERDDEPYDWVLLLQPTAPFSSPSDIIEAVELAAKGACDSVISVVRVLDGHPARIKQVKDGYLEAFCVPEVEGMRRQDLRPPAYARNGAIYLTRREVVVNQKSMRGDRIRPLVMPPERSVNIDEPLDLLLAEAVLKSGLVDWLPGGSEKIS